MRDQSPWHRLLHSIIDWVEEIYLLQIIGLLAACVVIAALLKACDWIERL